MDFGLRGGQHAYRPYAASLPVCVPTVEGLFPASFRLAARLAPRDFRSAVPYGYLHRSRQDRFILLESAHAGHTGARLQACRVAIRGDIAPALMPALMPVQQTTGEEDHPLAAVFALLLRAAVEVRSTGARGASQKKERQKKSGKCSAGIGQAGI